MKRKLEIGATAGALAAALILVLTACGGNGDTDDVASLTDTTGQTTTDGTDDGGSGRPTEGEEAEEAALEFAQCMREHGVDFPDPVNGRFELRSAPGNEEKLEEAQEACGDILEGFVPELDEEQQAEMQDALLAFARCMREHGVDFPDPQFEEGGGALMQMPPGAEDDPKFDEAQRACQPILDDAQLGEPSLGGEDS